MQDIPTIVRTVYNIDAVRIIVFCERYSVLPLK